MKARHELEIEYDGSFYFFKFDDDGDIDSVYLTVSGLTCDALDVTDQIGAGLTELMRRMIYSHLNDRNEDSIYGQLTERE